MTEKIDFGEVANFKALLMTNAIQLDALAELLIEKGIITEEEFFDRLKKVQTEYQENEDANLKETKPAP
jgi:hypothetical protein